MTIGIRDATPRDGAAIKALYSAAFPEENLLPLVCELMGLSEIVSLVALAGPELTGQVFLTSCGIKGRPGTVALLGPLAVRPDRQRGGIGSALVREGLARSKEAGIELVCVLGDPAYYSRFGFTPEHGVAPPYTLPEKWRDAWQSLRLTGDAAELEGTLAVPAPWRRETLWLP